MKFPHILLDLDNTILDFRRSSLFGFENALKVTDPDRSWEDVYSTFEKVSHRLWRDFEKGIIHRDFLRIERFRQVCSQHKLNVSPVEFSERYLELICENSFFIEGAEELCKKLSHDGYEVAVVTNGLEDVQTRRLKNTGLDACFLGLFCSSEESRPKPFPDLFSAAHKFLGKPNKQFCLMIGDSLDCDVLGAKKFGFQTCWFNANMSARAAEIVPHFEVHSLEKIYDILR